MPRYEDVGRSKSDEPPAPLPFRQPAAPDPAVTAKADNAHKAIYEKWWFWAAAGAVVVAGAVILAVAIDPTTEPARGCMNVADCIGSGRAQ